MPGYFLFSSTCKCVRPAQSRRAELGGAAPISQLINFIFTHLFLNALSDGRAAEVLARPQSEAVGATRGGGRGAGVGGSEPMDLLPLYYSLKVIRGERTRRLISASALIQNRPDGSKPCSMSDIEIFFLFNFFFFFFLGDSGWGGGISTTFLSRNPSPDSLADFIYFLASVLQQLSKCKCAT